MNISIPAGSRKSAKPIVEIQRKIKVDEEGKEMAGVEEFWLVNGQGQVLSGPFFSEKDAELARRAYLSKHGYEI